MSATPTIPHIVEVVTATRKVWDADSAARIGPEGGHVVAGNRLVGWSD